MYMCTSAYMYTYVHTCTFGCTYIYVYVYTYIYMYIYARRHLDVPGARTTYSLVVLNP